MVNMEKHEENPETKGEEERNVGSGRRLMGGGRKKRKEKEDEGEWGKMTEKYKRGGGATVWRGRQ